MKNKINKGARIIPIVFPIADKTITPVVISKGSSLSSGINNDKTNETIDRINNNFFVNICVKDKFNFTAIF